jgi:hypothetical protein
MSATTKLKIKDSVGRVGACGRGYVCVCVGGGGGGIFMGEWREVGTLVPWNEKSSGGGCASEPPVE